MTKIQSAQNELAALEAKRSALERQVLDYQSERSRLKPTSPDDQTRAPALEAALAALRDELQFLQNDHKRARQKITDLERERDNLAAVISGIETRAAAYGGDAGLLEVERAAHGLVVVFRRSGNPDGLPEADRQALAFELWAKALRADIAALDNWRARLADFGD